MTKSTMKKQIVSYYIRIFILLSAKQVNIYKCLSKITNIVENDKNTLNWMNSNK